MDNDGCTSQFSGQILSSIADYSISVITASDLRLMYKDYFRLTQVIVNDALKVRCFRH